MIQLHWLVAVALPLLIAPGIDAQSVVRVGAGHHATIQGAIQAAAAGDIVLVDAGVYEAFTVGKPLTITAQPSALVQIVSLGAIHITLSPFQACNLAGLDIEVASMTMAGGICSAERCTIRTTTGLHVTGGMLSTRWSSVWAADDSGLVVQNGILHGTEGTFATAAGSSPGTHRAALAIRGVSQCSLSTCTLTGAWPNTAQQPDASVALDVAGLQASTERAWLLDCSLFGGFDPQGNVGAAIRAPALPAVPPVRLHRQVVLGAVEGAVAYGTVIGVRTTVDMTIGAPFTTVMTGDPGNQHLFYAGTALAGWVQLPHVEQLAFGLANTVIFGLVPGDAQGDANYTFVLPNDPLIRHAVVWWRSVDVFAVPWQVTPAFVTIVQ